MKDYPKRPNISLEALDPNTSLALIARLVGSEKRVLDVGCASGYQAHLLAENGCITTGIEINESAAQIAREVCDRVHVADIERSHVSEIVAGELYDVVVFGDVLEHLINPLAVLENVRNVLRPNGVVVASIPNIAHGAIRLALLRGDFDYQPLGILDDTHIRFFTYKTLRELFTKAGFEIEEIERTTVDIFSGSDLLPTLSLAEFSPDVISKVEADPESRTLQFVFRARQASRQLIDEQVRRAAIEAELHAATRRLDTAESLLAEKSAELVLRTGEFEERFEDFKREIERTRGQAEVTLVETRQIYEAQHLINVATITELQERVLWVHRALEKSQSEFQTITDDLRAQLGRAISETNAERSHSLQTVALAESANAELCQQIATFQAHITDLDRVLGVMREERTELSLAYIEVEHQLINQTRARIEQARDELETLARITASTHESRFWKIKLVLVKIRARIRFIPRFKSSTIHQ